MSKPVLKVNQLHQKLPEGLPMQHNMLLGGTQSRFLIAICCRPIHRKIAVDFTCKKSDDFMTLKAHLFSTKAAA